MDQDRLTQDVVSKIGNYFVEALIMIQQNTPSMNTHGNNDRYLMAATLTQAMVTQEAIQLQRYSYDLPPASEEPALEPEHATPAPNAEIGLSPVPPALERIGPTEEEAITAAEAKAAEDQAAAAKAKATKAKGITPPTIG